MNNVYQFPATHQTDPAERVAADLFRLPEEDRRVIYEVLHARFRTKVATPPPAEVPLWKRFKFKSEQVFFCAVLAALGTLFPVVMVLLVHKPIQEEHRIARLETAEKMERLDRFCAARPGLEDCKKPQ